METNILDKKIVKLWGKRFLITRRIIRVRGNKNTERAFIKTLDE